MNSCPRSILTFTATLIGAAFLMCSDASAQNLLVNADFETGDLTGWVLGGESPSSTISVVSPDNGPSFAGTNSVLLDNQAQAIGLAIKQSTAPGVLGEGEIFYSFDLKSIESANGGVFFVEIFAEQNGVGVIGGTGVLGPYTPADWTTYQGSFIAPAGTDFATIQFSAITGAVDGSISTMLVDNPNLSERPVSGEVSSFGELKADFR